MAREREMRTPTTLLTEYDSTFYLYLLCIEQHCANRKYTHRYFDISDVFIVFRLLLKQIVLFFFTFNELFNFLQYCVF